MPYSRKELHRDLDDLLDKKGYGDDISMEFGRIHIEISFQNGKVQLKHIDRESFSGKVIAPATG